MCVRHSVAPIAAMCVAIAATCVAAEESSTDQEDSRSVPVFETDVLPIFKARCNKCHSGKSLKAELDLSTSTGVLAGGESGEVLEPGKPDGSLLYEMLHDGLMPPEGEPQLSKQELERIRRWIKSGAKFSKPPKPTEPQALKFVDVLPLILRRCWMCHGPEYQFGGVDLRSYAGILKGGDNGPAIIAGKPTESPMVQRVRSKQCPPKPDIGEAGIEPMTPTELTRLEQWIADGAVPGNVSVDGTLPQNDPLVSESDREFWSFTPPHKSTPPQFASADISHPIDTFVYRKLTVAGLGFSVPADRQTLIRRAAFALTGLPPQRELMDRYLDDDRPDAFARVVDELLASPRYGEKWSRFWLDLAGYADSEGKRNADMIRPYAWKYRDWVIRAFNSDMPYDDFLRDQIAGDELVDWADQDAVTDDVLDHLIATGFLRMAPDGTSADPVNRFSDRLEVISDEIDTLGRGVLALTFNCARCHSHKYDPIPQRDYYRLVAVFKGAYDEYDWLTPQPFGNQWNKAKRRHMTVSTSEQRAQLEASAAPIRKQINDLQRQLKNVGTDAKENSRLQKAIAKQKSNLPKPDQIRALWDRGRASPTFIYRRGDENQPARLVSPGIPSALSTAENTYQLEEPNHSSPKTGRRLALANWLTHKQHPLTARVFVNRIWHQHFGRGIVESIDNFGKLGTPPSHPELLDWLAVEFVEHDWSIKHLHRLILTSQVWQQSSAVEPQHEQLDPANRLLSRMPMRRLTAEELRDSVLSAADRLNTTPFGQPDQVTIRKNGLVTSKSVGGYWRRSIYVRQRRKEMPTLFETFDLPQMNPNCTERKTSTVVSQPLLLLNNQMIYDLAGNFASSIREAAGTSRQRQVELSFERGLSRAPTEEELSAGLHVLESLTTEWKAAGSEDSDARALSDFCHVILNSAGFLYID